MASRPAETVDDLLRPVLDARRLTEWCQEVGIRPWTVLRLRRGIGGRVHAGTVAAIATKLRVPRERVEAAILASREAAGK